jgi:membrane-bound lytic murein transglycosylase D
VNRRTTVKAGKRDSVASIARRYKLSASQVADWNDVGPSAVFKAGQQVVVYLPVKTGVRSAGRARVKAAAPRAGVRKVPSRPSAKPAAKTQRR